MMRMDDDADADHDADADVGADEDADEEAGHDCDYADEDDDYQDADVDADGALFLGLDLLAVWLIGLIRLLVRSGPVDVAFGVWLVCSSRIGFMGICTSLFGWTHVWIGGPVRESLCVFSLITLFIWSRCAPPCGCSPHSRGRCARGPSKHQKDPKPRPSTVP